MNKKEATDLIDLLYSGSITEERFLFDYCVLMGKDSHLSNLFVTWCTFNNHIWYFVKAALINLIDKFNVIIITKDNKYHSLYINKRNGKEI